MSLLRIATRKSALALWQANHVRDLLLARHDGLAVELVPIVTRGDLILDRPLAEIGGKGLFLKELEQSLLKGEADIAVHSMKDVPPDMPPGLSLEVMLPRANPFDAWLSTSGAGLQDLPAGSRVGTSSLRRQCLLLSARPDLQVTPLRGNVDTRLAKLEDGQYDAIILAAAGLQRLGLDERIHSLLQPPDWLPAPTQGIIGIQTREGDDESLRLIQPLADHDSQVRARAERSTTRILQGSCQVPLAVYAQLHGQELDIKAMIGVPDGSRLLRAGIRGSADHPEALGEAVAGQLLEQGAAAIIEALSPA